MQLAVANYISIIKRHHIKPRSSQFIEDIVIYTDKTEVYKVLVRYNEKCYNKLRKLGLNSHFYFVEQYPKAKIIDDLVKNCKHERLTIIYNNYTQISTVVVGEERTLSTNSA